MRVSEPVKVRVQAQEPGSAPVQELAREPAPERVKAWVQEQASAQEPELQTSVILSLK